MTKKEDKLALQAAMERRQAARPEAGSVVGRAEGRPEYVGIQHPMRSAGGPKARSLPGLGDVMKDLAYRGGAAPEEEADQAEAKAEKPKEYNRTHRQSSASAARRRMTAAAEQRAAQEADASSKSPKSISSRSMQISDKSGGQMGLEHSKMLKGGKGQGIEDTDLADPSADGGSGLGALLEAKARREAKKRQESGR